MGDEVGEGRGGGREKGHQDGETVKRYTICPKWQANARMILLYLACLSSHTVQLKPYLLAASGSVTSLPVLPPTTRPLRHKWNFANRK